MTLIIFATENITFKLFYLPLQRDWPGWPQPEPPSDSETPHTATPTFSHTSTYITQLKLAITEYYVKAID